MLNSNTGQVTTDVEGLGQKSLARSEGSALAVGDLISGQVVSAIYGGTKLKAEEAIGTRLDFIASAESEADAAMYVSKVLSAATYSVLRGNAGPTTYEKALVSGRDSPGDGGQGEFSWDDSDLSAQVTTDPFHGVYVPPDSDPTGESGAWVRKHAPGGLSFAFFGAYGDGTLQTAAMQGAINHAQSLDTAVVIEGSPLGVYRFDQDLMITASNVTIDMRWGRVISNRRVHFKGNPSDTDGSTDLLDNVHFLNCLMGDPADFDTPIRGPIISRSRPVIKTDRKLAFTLLESN